MSNSLLTDAFRASRNKNRHDFIQTNKGSAFRAMAKSYGAVKYGVYGTRNTKAVAGVLLEVAKLVRAFYANIYE